MKNAIIVGIGGFIGSVCRYWISKLNFYNFAFSIPIGTLLVNVLGSFIIGILTAISLKNNVISHETQLFLMTGILGGFTTFSSFSKENLILFQNGQYQSVAIYTVSSVLLGLIAVFLGYKLVKMF